MGAITIDCRDEQTGPMSAVFLEMCGVLAELELSIIRTRVKSSLANARTKGRPKTTKGNIPRLFYKHYPSHVAGQINVSEFSRLCVLSRTTVYKCLQMLLCVDGKILRSKV